LLKSRWFNLSKWKHDSRFTSSAYRSHLKSRFASRESLSWHRCARFFLFFTDKAYQRCFEFWIQCQSMLIAHADAEVIITGSKMRFVLTSKNNTLRRIIEVKNPPSALFVNADKRNVGMKNGMLRLTVIVRHFRFIIETTFKQWLIELIWTCVMSRTRYIYVIDDAYVRIPRGRLRKSTRGRARGNTKYGGFIKKSDSHFGTWRLYDLYDALS